MAWSRDGDFGMGMGSGDLEECCSDGLVLIAVSTAKQDGATRGRWPEKSAVHLLGLLNNAVANAEMKGLDTDALVVSHIQVNQAPKQRRRTYRAHGRVSRTRTSTSKSAR